MTPEQVKRLRRSLNMTQSQFANMLGLAELSGRQTVRHWEIGKTDVSGPASLAMRQVGTIRDLKKVIDRQRQTHDAMTKMSRELLEALERTAATLECYMRDAGDDPSQGPVMLDVTHTIKKAKEDNK